MVLLISSFFASLFCLGSTAVFEIPSYEDDIVEKFYYDGLEYSFQDRDLSWHTAKLDCEARNQTLAQLNTDKKIRFVAESMAEFVPDEEDLWIGAKLDRVSNDWRWYRDDTVVPLKTWTNAFDSSYPPWSERHEVDSNEKENLCVAFDLKTHNMPSFVVLPCRLRRCYICEGVSSFRHSPREVGNGWVDGTRYTIYRARMTWMNAVEFCRRKRRSIATINSSDALRWAAQKMLRVRPVMENAWLGGSFNERHQAWEWITTGKLIPERSTNTSDFPPWKESPVNQRGCLLLDRRLCSKPVFVSAKCNKMGSFICQSPDPRPLVEVEVKHHGEIDFIIIENVLSWEDAQAECSSNTKYGSGRLLTLQNATATTEFLKTLVNAMVDATTELVHVWLGGRYDPIKGKWFWVEGQRKDYFDNRNVKIGQGNFCFLDAGMELSVASPCLNLDRDNHGNIVLYGLPCNISQAFVCYYPNRVSANSSKP